MAAKAQRRKWQSRLRITNEMQANITLLSTRKTQASAPFQVPGSIRISGIGARWIGVTVIRFAGNWRCQAQSGTVDQVPGSIGLRSRDLPMSSPPIEPGTVDTRHRPPPIEPITFLPRTQKNPIISDGVF